MPKYNIIPSRWSMIVLLLSLAAWNLSRADTSKLGDETVISAPHNLRLSVKVNAPYLEPADIQMICVFKHTPANDQYIAAMKDLDDKLGHAISTLRNRGEFAGDVGETFLLQTASTIPAKLILFIGIGDEQNLSLDTLKLAGRIAAREAVRLRAKSVAWAPTLRDQGSNVIEVGAGDAAFAQQFVLAYDTEKLLQTQSLAPPFDIESCVIEAGTSFFQSASRQVPIAVAHAADEIATRDHGPIVTLAK